MFPDIEQRVWAYLGGIAHENKITPLKIGGIEDHVHLVLGIHPSVSVSQTLKSLKTGSSGWIHDTFPEMREFGWQDGYAAFSVSKSHSLKSLPTLKISVNIIEPKPSKKNIWHFFGSTRSNSTNDMFSTEPSSRRYATHGL